MTEDIVLKEIYLRKGNEIVGLYSEGIEGPYTYTLEGLDGTTSTVTTNFQSFQSWGNEYTEDFKIKGRGSFRVFDLDIEDTAKAFEEEGWVRFEREACDEKV